MRVFTNKNAIANLKHFKYCLKNYERLLDLQQEVPNLPLEIESETAYKRYIPISSLNLEKFSEILNLNAHDAAFVK